MQYGFTITNQGKQMIESLLAGDTLIITKVKAGTGVLSAGDDPKTFTDLKNPAQARNGSFTPPAVSSSICYIDVSFDNSGLSTGYYINEFGVWAKGIDNIEKMIYYATLGDYPQYLSPDSSGVETRIFPIEITISQDLSVSMELNTSAFQRATIVGNSNPTTSTVGAISQLYLNNTTQEEFVCTGISNGSYTWSALDNGSYALAQQAKNTADSALALAQSNQQAITNETSANAILTKIKTVDGTGSGLDADKFKGNDTVPVANGGTGVNTLASGEALIGNGTGSVTTRAITNQSSAASPHTGTNLVNENTLFYAMPVINNATPSRATTVYAPGTGGTADQVLASTGATSAPVWKDQSVLTSGKAAKLETGRTLKVNLARTSASTAFDGSTDITDIGVDGILDPANGGTGVNSISNLAKALAGGNLYTPAMVGSFGNLSDSSTDADTDIERQGWCYINNMTTAKHYPASGRGYLIQTAAPGNTYIFQMCAILKSATALDLYMRGKYGTWTSWVRLGEYTHTHAATDITSGVLGIARGGTNAGDAATARTNLGITPANIGAVAATDTAYFKYRGIVVPLDAATDITGSGAMYCDNDMTTEKGYPKAGRGYLVQFAGIGSKYGLQLCYVLTTGGVEIYTREKYNGTWKAWEKADSAIRKVSSGTVTATSAGASKSLTVTDASRCEVRFLGSTVATDYAAVTANSGTTFTVKFYGSGTCGYQFIEWR